LQFLFIAKLATLGSSALQTRGPGIGVSKADEWRTPPEL